MAQFLSCMTLVTLVKTLGASFKSVSYLVDSSSHSSLLLFLLQDPLMSHFLLLLSFPINSFSSHSTFSPADSYSFFFSFSSSPSFLLLTSLYFFLFFSLSALTLSTCTPQSLLQSLSLVSLLFRYNSLLTDTNKHM